MHNRKLLIGGLVAALVITSLGLSIASTESTQCNRGRTAKVKCGGLNDWLQAGFKLIPAIPGERLHPLYRLR
jgi:hypothetical protein